MRSSGSCPKLPSSITRLRPSAIGTAPLENERGRYFPRFGASVKLRPDRIYPSAKGRAETSPFDAIRLAGPVLHDHRATKSTQRPPALVQRLPCSLLPCSRLPARLPRARVLHPLVPRVAR